MINVKKMGQNCIVGQNVTIHETAMIGHNCIIEDNVTIGSNAYIDNNTIIRSNVTIGSNAFIEANCIIGEYQMDFYLDRQTHVHPLTIGDNAFIRSGSILYSGSRIGNNFSTGHQVTIREDAQIGDNVCVGTLSDIQGFCRIGNYVRLHSNVHIGQKSIIDDFVWIFPYVVLTNDPTPPSEELVGVHVHPFAIIATGSIIMPGLEIGQDSLIGAGAIVTKSTTEYAVAVGNPAKVISDVRNIKNKVTGQAVYPWRYYFSRYMPWSEMGFDEWYASLSEDDKKKHSIANIH